MLATVFKKNENYNHSYIYLSNSCGPVSGFSVPLSMCLSLFLDYEISYRPENLSCPPHLISEHSGLEAGRGHRVSSSLPFPTNFQLMSWRRLVSRERSNTKRCVREAGAECDRIRALGEVRASGKVLKQCHTLAYNTWNSASHILHGLIYWCSLHIKVGIVYWAPPRCNWWANWS